MSDEKKPEIADLVATILSILHGEYPGTIKIEITAAPIQPVTPDVVQEIQK